MQYVWGALKSPYGTKQVAGESVPLPRIPQSPTAEPLKEPLEWIPWQSVLIPVLAVLSLYSK